MTPNCKLKCPKVGRRGREIKSKLPPRLFGEPRKINFEKVKADFNANPTWHWSKDVALSLENLL
jgi:hypothetical protein